MLTRLALMVGVVGGVLTAVGCSSSTSPSNTCGASGAAANISAASSNNFAPASATITKGQSVCWQNNGSSNHTVTADQGNTFDGELPAGATFLRAFPTAGTFAYHCRIHSGMVGTIIVQ